MTNGTVNITVDMTADQRRAALTAIAHGAQTVTMPADHNILDGRGVKRIDVHHYKGTVTVRGVNGGIQGIREAPDPANDFGGKRHYLSNYIGPRTSPTTYEAMVDRPNRQLTGTVTCDAQKFNRLVLAMALFFGATTGFIFSINGHLTRGPLVGVTVFAFVVAVGYQTKRRVARIMVADLQRMATLAVDKQPDRTGMRRYF